MAEMKIIQQRIERIEPHDNADRLEIAFTDTFDWPVIIGKYSFEARDKVIHFPVDCVIPYELENFLLGDSKIKLKNGRIRAAKIRGTISYGILAPAEKLQSYHSFDGRSKDLMKAFGCHKYEPPAKQEKGFSGVSGSKSWKRKNRNFTKYFDMNHLQNCKGIFDDEKRVAITEKLHGTSFRAGWVKRDPLTLWEGIKFRIRKIWDKDYQWEFVYGSRNVQLQDKLEGTFYKENVYSKMVKKYDLKKTIGKDVVIYAEIVGPGIQKNYQYIDDHDMFVYDIKVNGKYIDFTDRQTHIWDMNLKSVPVLLWDIYWIGYKDHINTIFNSPSKLDLSQKVKEGVVVEALEEKICRHGRKKVKVLNPEYLLNKTNTDFH